MSNFSPKLFCRFVRRSILLTSLSFSIAFFCRHLVVAQPDDASQKPGNDEQYVRAMVEGYLSNRDSFQNCFCRLEIRRIESADVTQVLLGKAAPTSVVEGLFVRDQGKERREVIVSDEALKVAMERGSIDFDPKLQVLQGGRGLYYGKDLNGAVLYSPKAPPEDTVIGPFSLGRFSSPRGDCNVDLILRQDHKIESVRVLTDPPKDVPANAFAAELVGLEYNVDVKGTKVVFQFFVAKDHGNLPIVSRRYVDGQLASSATITDVRSFDNKRFFPLRCVHIEHLDGDLHKAFTAVETRVVQLDVDKPVSDEYFKIQFARNTVFRDLSDDDSQTHFEKPRLVSLNDLDEMFALTAKASKRQKEIAQTRLGEATQSLEATGVKSNRIIYIVMGNLFMAAVLFCAWRFRKRRPTP